MSQPTQTTTVELLNEAETNAAREILRQKPELAKALSEYQTSYAGVLGKLRTVMLKLREASLNPKEQKLVLLGAQFNEQRASEIQKVVNDTDENFARFLKGEIGFRIALAQSRAALPSPTLVAAPKLQEYAKEWVSKCPVPFPKKKVSIIVEPSGCKITITFKPVKQASPKAPASTKAASKKANSKKTSEGQMHLLQADRDKLVAGSK